MRVCQGEVNEVRFKKMHDILENEAIVTEGEKEAAVLQQKNTISSTNNKSSISSQFVCTMDTVFHEGDQTFINDNIGYHKVCYCLCMFHSFFFFYLPSLNNVYSMTSLLM